MDKKVIIESWINSSDKDFATMNDMYKTKHYDWALFMGHLCLEKLLKAVYIKNTNENPPLIHDLRRLAEKANLTLTEEQQIRLDSISRFNIRARYDDHKQSFYKLCTLNFTNEWMQQINECRLWIKQLL
ncbi:MAG: HEPN domain-containing protein [Bacteroidales bacterium]|nr:HEPN domain-containing protein [Bacteroidales bacterium]